MHTYTPHTHNDKVGVPKGRGLLMLGEMSSSGTLAAGDYTQATVKVGVHHVFLYVCMYVSMYVCMYVCMYAYTYA